MDGPSLFGDQGVAILLSLAAAGVAWMGAGQWRKGRKGVAAALIVTAVFMALVIYVFSTFKMRMM